MKKYNVIYADPPWNIKAGRPIGGYVLKNGTQVFVPHSNKSRSLSYPSMTIESIKNLDVKSISAKNAHLYIWVTNSHLPKVFQIIESWGFKYSTTIVWAKNRMGGGLGGAFRITTEYLIFARKGNLKADKSIGSTWHNVKRTYENGAPKHSKKPEYFYNLIEEVSPGDKIELFARQKRSGWGAWGNEVSSDIELNSITDHHITTSQNNIITKSS
ncbi:MT-A70 family methyltransferase [Cyclobacterium sediminis]